MKRSLAKPAKRGKAAAGKAAGNRLPSRKNNDRDAYELFITAAAVLAFFFSVLASMALNSELKTAAAVGESAGTIENYVNRAQIRLQNEATMNSIDALKRQNIINKK